MGVIQVGLNIKEECIYVRSVEHNIDIIDIIDEKIYRWIRAQLDQLPFPYELISGNHDDSVLMAEVFDQTHLLNGSELCAVVGVAQPPPRIPAKT